MKKSALTMFVLATALLISAPAMAVTLTMNAITATGQGVYDTTAAVTGDRFIAQINVTNFEAGVATVAYAVKWDPDEVALVAFTDGRTDKDGLFTTNTLSVGRYSAAAGELFNNGSYPGGGGSSNTVKAAGAASAEQFTETLNANGTEIDGFLLFKSAGFSTGGAQLGAIAQISFIVLTPANGPTDIDIEVFFRPSIDGIIGTGASGDLTGAADITAANLAIEGSAAIPEPATLFLLGSGLAGLAGFGRRRYGK